MNGSAAKGKQINKKMFKGHRLGGKNIKTHKLSTGSTIQLGQTHAPVQFVLMLFC